MAVQIVRLAETNADALQLLGEYYEAVHVVQRDTGEAIQALIGDTSGGLWLARLDGKAVGCVALRKIKAIPFAVECKRLYIQPHARGYHLADALLDAQEEYAVSQGMKWIYLDTYDDLKAAIALYLKRGYVRCQRYNDNPQATQFFRKQIG